MAMSHKKAVAYYEDRVKETRRILDMITDVPKGVLLKLRYIQYGETHGITIIAKVVGYNSESFILDVFACDKLYYSLNHITNEDIYNHRRSYRKTDYVSFKYEHIKEWALWDVKQAPFTVNYEIQTKKFKELAYNKP